MDNSNDWRTAKILYVDDDEELIYIFSNFLEKSGYNFKTAMDVDSGLAIARKFLPDMIISDVAMPGKDGFEFCRSVREDPDLSSTLFILVSGIEIDSDDVVRGFNSGADDYLLKPFSHDVFTSKIASLLRIKTYSEKYQFFKSEYEVQANKIIELEKELSKEKDLLNNSLKQIMYMTEERDELLKNNQDMKSKIKEDTRNITSMLSDLIESKSQYHRGHSQNVAEISSAIAGLMGLTEEDIESIKTAALLHEIGKLSIPDELSMKQPGDYSEFETDVLTQHPLKGAGYLEKISSFEKTAKIIKYIHEKVDGTGSPEGLKKSRIPVGSMIIAAASAYDNLVIRLRKASPLEALAMLESKIGTYYDHAVVHNLRKYISNQSSDNEPAPKEIRIFEIKPGMTLAAGIYTTKGTKLLPENCVLTEDSISQIAKYNKIDLIEDIVFIK